MKKIIYLVPTLSLVGCISQHVEEKPNVIVILADSYSEYRQSGSWRSLFHERICHFGNFHSQPLCFDDRNVSVEK